MGTQLALSSLSRAMVEFLVVQGIVMLRIVQVCTMDAEWGVVHRDVGLMAASLQQMHSHCDMITLPTAMARPWIPSQSNEAMCLCPHLFRHQFLLFQAQAPLLVSAPGLGTKDLATSGTRRKGPPVFAAPKLWVQLHQDCWLHSPFQIEAAHLLWTCPMTFYTFPV